MHRSTQEHRPDAIDHRQADYPVNNLFLRRWSPRSFDPAPMSERELFSLLEAARWAPSAFNIQPWRFIYSLRDDADWACHLDLLDPFNASWAKDASALLFLVSDKLMPRDGSSPHRPSNTHSFDAGAAWAQLALQATALGYQAHAMAGIRFDAVRVQLAVPENYRVEIAVAIGRQADASRLPKPLRLREVPSPRLPLEQIAFAGSFPSQPQDGAPDSRIETGEEP